MLTFKSFDIKNEEAEIVQFLKDNSDQLLAKGGTYHGGRICFFYSSEKAPIISPAEIDKNFSIEYLDKKITEYKAMILDSDSIALYWRGMALKGNTSASSKVIDTLDQRDNQAIQLGAFLQMRKDVEAGLYSFEYRSASVKELTPEGLNSEELAK